MRSPDVAQRNQGAGFMNEDWILDSAALYQGYIFSKSSTAIISKYNSLACNNC